MFCACPLCRRHSQLRVGLCVAVRYCALFSVAVSLSLCGWGTAKCLSAHVLVSVAALFVGCHRLGSPTSSFVLASLPEMATLTRPADLVHCSKRPVLVPGAWLECLCSFFGVGYTVGEAANVARSPPPAALCRTKPNHKSTMHVCLLFQHPKTSRRRVQWAVLAEKRTPTLSFTYNRSKTIQVRPTACCLCRCCHHRAILRVDVTAAGAGAAARRGRAARAPRSSRRARQPWR